MFYSVNSYSSASNRKGVSGLISGMDTDELVKGLTMGTQNKITLQLQKKQTAAWKQASYREMTKGINELQNKYFSFSAGKNNLMSSSFFDASSIINTSKFVRVSGSTSSAKNLQIRDIKELASTANTTSSSALSSQEISGGRIYDQWHSSAITDESFVINIDGKDVELKLSNFQFSPEESLTPEGRKKALADTLNKAISSSEYKDKISFSFDTNGKFKINALADEDGKKLDVKMGDNSKEQKESNLWKSLGLSTMALNYDGELTSTIPVNTSDMVKSDPVKFAEAIKGKTFSVTFNGVSKKMTFADSDAAMFDTPEKATDYVNGKLSDLFGNNTNGNQKVTASFDPIKGGMTIKTDDKFDIVKLTSTDKGLFGKTGALGIADNVTNRVSWNTPINELGGELAKSLGSKDSDGNYKLTINNVDIKINEKDSLASMLKKIESSDAGVRVAYSTTSDTLSISAKDSGDIGKINITENDFSKALFGDAGVNYKNNEKGKNASLEVSFDGGKTFQNITRTSNTFSLDGMNFELLGKEAADGLENIKFEVEGNTDEVVTKVKEFIKDYNAMIKLMSDKMKDAPTKEKYLPLTDEQKKEMSESDIKVWEENAKKGTMYNDQYISKILTDLRSNLFSPVEGVDFGLSQLGITSTGWSENGQLQLDPAGEAKLRKMLAEDPEGVKKIFSHVEGNPDTNKDDLAKSGIAVKMERTFQNFAGTLGGNGIFVNIAGKDTDAYGQDTLSRDIRRADTTLEKLKKTLIAEETRHYKQFAAMEKYLNNMNQQSSWLTQQMGQS